MAVQNFGTGGGGFQLSPGVNVSEIDLTTIVPSVDTTSGAIAGVFRWGPVGERVLVTSENDLVNKFGKPSGDNAETWFSAANFLSYSRTLYVSRAFDSLSQFSAIAASDTETDPSLGTTILNEADYDVKSASFGASTPEYIARWPGALGNSLKVSVCDNEDQYASTINLTGANVYSLNSHSISSATANGTSTGAGFSNGDVLTFSGSGWNTPATLSANTNSVGNVVSLTVISEGTYFGTLPTNPVAPTSVANSTGGTTTGTNATVNLNWITELVTGQFNGSMTLGVGSSTANVTLANTTVLPGNNPLPFVEGIPAQISIGDYIRVGDSSVGTQYLKVSAIEPTVAGAGGTARFQIKFNQPLKIADDITTTSINRFWEYYAQVNSAPGKSTYVEVNGNTALQIEDSSAQNDEVHVVVVDEDGGFTGSPGSVLEVYQALSRATDAKLSDGTTNYYKNAINTRSNYVWVGADRAGSSSQTALNIQSSTGTAPLTLSFRGGVDISETAMTLSYISKAYDLFVSPEDSDIALVIAGPARGGVNNTQLANYIIDNIAEVRKDCVVFVSPAKSDVVNQTLNATQNVIDFRNSLRSTSYAVLDSGYKYQYDKYNDVYRWIPLNGDIAGLCARTDADRDPWFSPAGISRGAIRNIIKLAYNPNKSERDQLYKNGINPVITQQGQGTNLFGDKTLLAKPSAFDRINVRRLFIVLEKSISNAAKSLLFEFNDEFTRAQFRNLVEPFLREVQGRRGIYDFKVVCDESNNPPEVIDSNRFVGDIYVKPAKSINYIQLSFVAVRSGVEFSEITG